MRRLFGKAKEEAPPAKVPSLQEASAKIDLQVQGLEVKIAKADDEIRELVAKSSTNPSAKQRALQAMKKKKLYEQQRDQLIGTQFNIENLAFQQEQADITMITVEAMKAGKDQLVAAQKKINIDAVDKLTDDMADLQAEMKEIGDALSANMAGVGADEDELADEYAALEAEMAAETLMGLSKPAASSTTAGPYPAMGAAELPAAPAAAVLAPAAFAAPAASAPAAHIAAPSAPP